MSDEFVQFRSITKSFGGVTALDDVTLGIHRGDCHGLIGENGAGKSTLGKLLAGIHRIQQGEIFVDGECCKFGSPGDALRAGVAMVHQELAFCPDLSVAENLFMGRYPRRGGFLDRKKMEDCATILLNQIGVTLDVKQYMRSLSTAQEQLVQIAAAVGSDPRILIFDEPTSSLSEIDVQALFRVIDDLKARGITIIYISHRMPELFRLCDKVSVLCDGRHVGTLAREKMTQEALMQMMIGRNFENYFPHHLSVQPGKSVLSVRNLTSSPRFHNVSFDVKAGEIVGLAGLIGSGRSEVAKAIFGLDTYASGTIEVEGKSLRRGSVKTAMQMGVAFVPEDRKRQGCVLSMSCRANISMSMLDRLHYMGMLDRTREKQTASYYFDQLQIKAASPEAPVASLSGGNQQKVVLAKWLARGGKLLIVDEPTRGVDIGAKAAIHALINDLAQNGLAIILISSELPEILNLSTRILVMREGQLVGELSRAEASQDAILRRMACIPKAA